jgi:hypothetical protein
MKEFLFHTLNRLDKLCGLRQIEKIYASHESKEDAKIEINELLDILCGVCAQFKQIPEEEQQKIILERLVADSDCIGLNAKTFYKWFMNSKGPWNKEVIESDPLPEGYKVLEGEEREQAIKTWLESLKGLTTNVNQELKGSGKVKAQIAELPVLKGYTPPTADEVYFKQKHIDYVRENYDVRTGKPLETWIPEKEWLENELNK